MGAEANLKMKLFASLLAATQAAVTTLTADKCMICEFTGFADSEDSALDMLAGTEKVTLLTVKPTGTANSPFDSYSATIPDIATFPDNDVLSMTTVNPCIAGGFSGAFDESMASGAIRNPTTDEQSDYCVATFFMYHAK